MKLARVVGRVLRARQEPAIARKRSKMTSRRRVARLLGLARYVMGLPHNRPGVDKSHVASVMFYYRDYFRRVRAAHAR
jgi:hypothetical protein